LRFRQDLMTKVWSASAATFTDACAKAERRIRTNRVTQKATDWQVVDHSRGLVQELSGDLLAALAILQGREVLDGEVGLERVWGYRACEPILDDVRLAELFNKVCDKNTARLVTRLWLAGQFLVGDEEPDTRALMNVPALIQPFVSPERDEILFWWVSRRKCLDVDSVKYNPGDPTPPVPDWAGDELTASSQLIRDKVEARFWRVPTPAIYFENLPGEVGITLSGPVEEEVTVMYSDEEDAAGDADGQEPALAESQLDPDPVEASQTEEEPGAAGTDADGDMIMRDAAPDDNH